MNFGKLTEEAGEANEPPWLLKIVSSVFYVCVRCFEWKQDKSTESSGTSSCVKDFNQSW